MGQALYRKNRPKSLDEVVGQEHITTTLKNALKKGAISHAYLFTGPKGVGKTSVARILAHDINGIPYKDDSMHLDIIEIDAASNRRIDEIRDLRDRVHVAPTSAKYKIYIIDEVHMLTREAFNALLKTLEEPPAHVVFILATTESHKLPATIVSRTQRFTFKPIALETVIEHLRQIADSEKIDITDDALELIARHGEGSFRDSISLLDQTAGSPVKIEAGFLRSMLGIPSDESIDTMVQELDNHEISKIILSLEQLRNQGFSAAHIAKQLGTVYRAKLLDNGARTNIIDLLQNLLRVPAAYDPEKFLEIILLEYALVGETVIVKASAKTVVTPAKIESPVKPKQAGPVTAGKPQPKPPLTAGEKTRTPKTASTPQISTIDETVWPRILADLKKKHNTLYGIVRMAKPSIKENQLVLGFAFAFHRKRLSEKKNQQIIAGIVRNVTGKDYIIRCVDDDTAHFSSSTVSEVHSSETEEKTRGPQDKQDLASISNIFGGGEILEP